MATVGGKQIKDLAAARKANIKATGGIPVAKPAGSALGGDAKNIKIRQNAENEAPDAYTPRKRR